MVIHYISKQDVAILNGKDNFSNDIWVIAQNSVEGREHIANKCPPEIVAEVMAVWGDEPTIPDDVTEPTPEPTPAQQIYSLKQQISDTDYKIIKCSECQLANMPLPYDVKALHEERQALRDKINVLENTTP